MLIDGEFVLVRHRGGTTGWVALPQLSEAQGEVVNFTAAMISYLRGDFEQAETFFASVRDSKAESLVRHDAALLAGISRFRRGQGIETLRAAQASNPYSRYAVQATVTADIMAALALRPGETRQSHLAEARPLDRILSRPVRAQTIPGSERDRCLRSRSLRAGNRRQHPGQCLGSVEPIERTFGRHLHQLFEIAPEETSELAADLERAGFTVWWDKDITPGEPFRDSINAELAIARAAIVIWTPPAVKSNWVISEVTRAERRTSSFPSIRRISCSTISPRRSMSPHRAAGKSRRGLRGAGQEGRDAIRSRHA